jgi:hypothetical protein
MQEIFAEKSKLADWKAPKSKPEAPKPEKLKADKDDRRDFYDVGDRRFFIGQNVRVKRTNGETDSDWMFKGFTADGQVLVTRGKLYKYVDREIFLWWQMILHEGDKAKVLRSDGTMESDWIIERLQGNRAILEKHRAKDVLSKIVPLDKLIEWQKPKNR